MFALWRKEVYLSHLTFRFVPRLFNWNVSVFINCQHCTQAVKNSPAMQEMQVRALGVEDPLEKEMATNSSSCLGIPVNRGDWWATVHRVTKHLDMT